MMALGGVVALMSAADMDPMARAALAFGIAALIAGTVAAYCWFRASRTPLHVKPFLHSTRISIPRNAERDPEFVAIIERPGEESTKVLVAFAAAVKSTLDRTGRLNSIAATWSAAAAILGGLSAILGSLR